MVRVERARVLLGFLRHALDFGAPDGRPVRVLFTMLSPSVRLHLRVLGELTFALHDGRLKELLRAEATPEAILETVRLIRRDSSPIAPRAPGGEKTAGP